jgi:hypothetical protein
MISLGVNIHSQDLVKMYHFSKFHKSVQASKNSEIGKQNKIVITSEIKNSSLSE